MAKRMVAIDAEELQALRVLARKSLDSSEGASSPLLDASEDDGNDDSSDESAPLLVGTDCQIDDPHPDWYKLTLNERSVMCRLAAAYPQHVAHNNVATRFCRTNLHPELEAPLNDSSTVICHIRRQLGDDAVETVYQYKTNDKGRMVRVGKSIGYRLGRRYAQELV